VLEAWGRTIKKFDEQLDHYKKHVKQMTGNERNPSYYTDEKWSAWVREKALRSRWSLALTRFALVTSNVTTYQTATLDGIFFCTENHQRLKKYCNCCVEETYFNSETGIPTKAYGKIKDIFVHKVPCHETDEEVYDSELRRKLLIRHAFTDSELLDGLTEPNMWREEVFINCDWYSSVDEEQKRDLISGLPRVSYDPGLSLNSRISYLKFMHAHNISLWPANGPDYKPEDHTEPLLVLHTNYVH
jgi:hypothetical protein